MAEQFGKTWWGREWLLSLSHIDYENRLPRGAAYARKGNVEEINLKDRVITAKVSGSRPLPYKVKIVVPPFLPDQVNRFMGELVKCPGIISRLLNRELAPEIISVARMSGLKIFPERWSDLQMHCNCPDWAVPCKHLAAVVYMFSREIDNNPFIVFQVHGIDLLEELKKRGIFLEDKLHEGTVSLIQDVVRCKSNKEICYDVPEFYRIDFSKLEDCSEALFKLLSANPPFSERGDFKERYVADLRRAQKGAQRFFSGKLNAGQIFPEIYTAFATDNSITTEHEFRLRFNGSFEWSLAQVSRGMSHMKQAYITSDALPFALLQIHPDFLSDYHPTVIALHQGLMCALHLLSKGMVAPQILLLDNDQYVVRWLPAYMDQRVREIMDMLEKIIPDTFVEWIPSGKKLPKYILDKGEWIVSYFLEKLMRRFTLDSNCTSLERLFFKGAHESFHEPGEREFPGGIKSWIASYTLTQSDYRPVLYVEEGKTDGFDLTLGVEYRRQANLRIVALTDVLSLSDFEAERFRILRSFTILASLIQEVNTYISEGARTPIHYTDVTFLPFLLQVIPAVRMLDIKVFMPKSLKDLIRPRASFTLKRKSGSEKGFFNLSDLFAFDWEVALGDEFVSLDEFMALQQKACGLIRFKQKYIYTDADTLNRLQEAFSKMDMLSPAQMLQAALTEEYNSVPVRLSDEVRELIRELTLQEKIELPKGLQAQLRPYQERGFSWMYRNMRVGFGSILADDMGLGKTLQSITLILKLKEEGRLEKEKVLIVVPTGLLTNWQAEISRFAPSLSVFVYHGASRELKHFDADILLTTYGVLRSDQTKLKRRKWLVMLIDEAQNIKNQDTAQSKAVRGIPAATHIALSGTPVENHLTEFWCIMDYANKGYLDTLKVFKEHYANPIQLFNDLDCAERFRKVTAPFMMRRMKTDKTIISDLPDKMEQDDYASLKPDQAALYDSTLKAAMAEIEEITETDHESLFKRQGLILQMILALKQICNHPAQFLKNGDCRPELSGKVEMLLERVENIVANGEKVLIFTQFTEMGKMLVGFIADRTGRKPLFYHGACSIAERQEMVDRFQTERQDAVFVLSLKAAGTGLNLTAASHVIHYDLWWNPAVEAQATDRAYRIGQKKNVLVHRFITKDTFEERINNMIQKKKALADLTVACGESWIGNLSNKELWDIFG